MQTMPSPTQQERENEEGMLKVYAQAGKSRSKQELYENMRGKLRRRKNTSIPLKTLSSTQIGWQRDDGILRHTELSSSL